MFVSIFKDNGSFFLHRLTEHVLPSCISAYDELQGITENVMQLVNIFISAFKIFLYA